MPRRKKSSNENQSRASSSINKEKPQQRYAANARERARMRVLSRAFCRLKTTLPWVPADTKLSKLDTLRLAASYIAHLKGILTDETLGSTESSLHPAMSMTWPFGFNRPLGGSGSQEGGSILGSEDDEDDDDIDDDDDEESISNCGWDEVSSPGKDCIHLDTKGRARGRGSNIVSNRQVYDKKLSPSSPSTNKHSQNTTNICISANAKSEGFELNNFCNTSQHSSSIRPLSQSQHHHQQQQQQNIMQEHLQNEDMIYHHSYEMNMKGTMLPPNSLTATAMMAVTNLENAPPSRLQSVGGVQENEILVGVGNTDFLDEIHPPNFTQISHHVNQGGNEIHDHNSSSVAYAFSNTDLISIG